MMVDSAERCHICRIEAHQQNLREQYRIHSYLEQAFKDFIILFQYGYCLSFYKTVRPGLMIMMTVLALITAELFICPAVADLISTFQASCRVSWGLLQIIHIHIFFKANLAKPATFSNTPETIFLFLYQCFSLF